MKKISMLIPLLGIVFVSCTNSSNAKVNSQITTAPQLPETENLGVKCYISLVGNDTVTMRLNINVTNEVNGKLTYHKDKKEGIIVGNIKNDTLIAEYTFTTEGKSSTRQVAFLKKNSKYIEGYGTTLESGGKTIFSAINQLKFNDNAVFNEVDCKE